MSRGALGHQLGVETSLAQGIPSWSWSVQTCEVPRCQLWLKRGHQCNYGGTVSLAFAQGLHGEANCGNEGRVARTRANGHMESSG
jgi:hypothetical protein